MHHNINRHRCSSFLFFLVFHGFESTPSMQNKITFNDWQSNEIMKQIVSQLRKIRQRQERHWEFIKHRNNTIEVFAEMQCACIVPFSVNEGSREYAYLLEKFFCPCPHHPPTNTNTNRIWTVFFFCS